MDKRLNAINKAAEQVFIQKLLVDFTLFVREAPSKLLVQICTPFWKTDTNKAAPKAAREKLLKRAQSGFYPISIMGLFAAIYFALLFLLYITTLL
jgi:hypothetical protein